MLIPYKLFEKNRYEPNEGDKVIITYKDSKYYRNVGRVMFIRKDGDCDVALEYDGMVTFYKTNLKKIVQIVEVPSGEVFNILYDDCVDLALNNDIQFNIKKGYHYFKSENRWILDDYIL